jgi:hypothetical protein
MLKRTIINVVIFILPELLLKPFEFLVYEELLIRQVSQAVKSAEKVQSHTAAQASGRL